MKVRSASVFSAIVAVLSIPAPARSAIEQVVGGESVHQGETRRITVIGDGINFATSATTSDARIGVKLLSQKGIVQGRAKGQVLIEVAVPPDVPKGQDFNLTLKIAPNLYYSKGGSETIRLTVQAYPNSPWRPMFHFAPSWGWMNDPNGLVYVNGTYHLYYQAVPFSIAKGGLNWGHAVSSNLVQWSQRRDGMFSPPMDLLANSDDQNQVWSPFSGSAVVVSGEAAKQSPCGCSKLCVASIFTRNTPIVALQDQWLAASCNAGESFKEPERVLPNLTPSAKPAFRDPKVFPYQGRWIMVLAVGDRIELYESATLKQWKFLSALPLYSSLTPLGPFVETPDLIQLPVSNSKVKQTKWVMTYSEGFVPPSVCRGLRDSTGLPLTDPKPKDDCRKSRSFTSRSFYLIGEFDGRQFKPETKPQLLDFGSDFYAPQTWSNTPGRSIVAAWQNNWHYARQTPTTPWRGQLSIPRDLGLIRDGTYWLTQTPVPELAMLRKSVLRQAIRLQDRSLTNTTPKELQTLRATAFDLDLDLDVAGLPKVNSEIKIQLRSSNTSQGMVLTWRRTSPNQGVLSLTRSASEAGGATSELTQPESGFIGHWVSTAFPLAQVTTASSTTQSRLKLRILVDRSSVEVFAGDGRVVFSNLFFPDASNKEFQVYATGGTARIVNLALYPFSDD